MEPYAIGLGATNGLGTVFGRHACDRIVRHFDFGRPKSVSVFPILNWTTVNFRPTEKMAQAYELAKTLGIDMGCRTLEGGGHLAQKAYKNSQIF
jgi:hypothetical protein